MQNEEIKKMFSAKKMIKQKEQNITSLHCVIGILQLGRVTSV
jgi:hypothetical protein